MTEIMAVINATAKQYFAGAVDETIRKRLFLALLAKHGRILFNQSGYNCIWDVEKSEHPVQSYGVGGEYSFQEHDFYEQLEIDWRGYLATDEMHEKNVLMNGGDLAIVNLYDSKMPKMRKSIDNHLHGECYIDGNATNNQNRLHGLKSFTGYTACTAADLVAKNNDTYAGKSTTQGNGATWSSDLGTSPNAALASDWPDGNGPSEYDYLSCLLLNRVSNNWVQGTTDFADTCGVILRRATTWLTKNGGKDGRPTAFMLASDLFNDYQDYQEAKFRNVLPHPEARDLDFPDVLNQNGVMIAHEFDVPAGEGFAINVKQMEMACLGENLINTRGPYYDIKSSSYLFKAGYYGNFRYNPKYFGHIADFTS